MEDFPAGETLLRVGVDTGGTFTDFVVCHEGRLEFLKLPSTPAKPEQAVLEGLSRLLGDASALVQHGFTVGTNALLERKGGKIVLVTTEGFQDVLEIGRQNRARLYSLTAPAVSPLVPRSRRVGIRERTLHDGTRLEPLKRETLDQLLEWVRRRSPQAIAVVLLHSYVNPRHEELVGQALSGAGIPVSLSSRVLPEFREYERTSATVINAYLTPVVDRYLEALRSSPLLKQGRLTVMQSNGGTVPLYSGSVDPVRTLFSGPAGGVAGAFRLARQAGYDRIITLDMGGTSTDVCLCDQRVPSTGEAEVDRFPLPVRTIPIRSVGAGGGSIAWVDSGGLLRVGPKSAGSSPGPVCYGRGRSITVTDANLFLGRIDAERFLDGEMNLDSGRLPRYLKRLSDQLKDRSWSPEALCGGIVKIANTQMETALRMISLEKGHDTRDFTLVSYGGAGGLHACELARSLMIPRVLVPPGPGLISARGMMESQVVRDLSRTVRLTFTGSNVSRRLLKRMTPLVNRARRQLARDGFAEDRIEVKRSVDLRYLGQGYEINVPYSRNLLRAFHKKHERLYGYSNPGLAVEVVTLRVRAAGSFPELPLPEAAAVPDAPPRAVAEKKRKVVFKGRRRLTRFYDRDRLLPGTRLKAPAVITEYGATTLIPPGFKGRVDRWRNLILESGRAGEARRGTA